MLSLLHSCFILSSHTSRSSIVFLPHSLQSHFSFPYYNISFPFLILPLNLTFPGLFLTSSAFLGHFCSSLLLYTASLFLSLSLVNLVLPFSRLIQPFPLPGSLLLSESVLLHSVLPYFPLLPCLYPYYIQRYSPLIFFHFSFLS